MHEHSGAAHGARVLRFTIAACLLAGCSGVSAAPTPRERVVTIEAFVYHPTALTVAVGDTVVWRNRDLVPHTATAKGTFDTGSIAMGAERKWVAKRRGEFAYDCTFHPTMKATLTVQ